MSSAGPSEQPKAATAEAHLDGITSDPIDRSADPSPVAPIAHDPVPDGVASGVVIFTMQRCPFCSRVRALFEHLGVAPRYLDIGDPENQTLYADTAKATGHPTLPLVLIDGQLLGGCDDTCLAVDSGELQRRLNLPSVRAAIPEGGERTEPPPACLLMFPPVVNRWVAQGTAIIALALAIVVIVHHEDAWAHWVVVGMGLDFLVRLVAGGSASLKGATTLPIAALLQEELSPGPSKQFAALCGVIFCGLSASLYIGGEDGSATSEVGGSVVIGILAGCAFLEGFLNFCVGCFVFGIMNQLRIVPDTVYQAYTDLLGMFIYSINETNRKTGWAAYDAVKEGDVVADQPQLLAWRQQIGKTTDPIPEPVRVNMMPHPSGLRSAALDPTYKFPKTDDTIREHFGVCYIQFEDFGCPLAIAGFAAALRGIADIDGFYMPNAVYETVGYIAAVLHGLLFLGYIAKMFLAPRKVLSDLYHPMKRLTLAFIPLTHLVFAVLLDPETPTSGNESRFDLQRTMFWAGVAGVSIHFVLSMATWMKDRASPEQFSPMYLLPACSAIVVGFAGTVLARTTRADTAPFIETSNWFLGMGLFYYIVFTAATMGKSFQFWHWSDDRVRPSVTLWTAGAFLSCATYVRGGMAFWGLTQFDLTAYALFAVGVGLFLVNVYLVFPGRWLLRGKFEMANWAIAFACDTFVFAATVYRQMHGHDFSRGVLWVALVFAGWANYTMFFHTLALLVGRKWPRAPQKWSPLSFNKLQHEAMRVMLEKLHVEAAHPTPEDPSECQRYVARLVEQWEEYERFATFHAHYEDKVLFPELAAFNRTQIAPGDAQHEMLEAQIEALKQLTKPALAGEDFAITQLKTRIVEHGVSMVEHVQWEEDHMQPLIRKNLNLAIHIDIIQQVWRTSDVQAMEDALVTVVRHLPMHGQRVRFLKALTWALPERSQQVGTWLYRGLARDPLGDMKYALIVDDMPEIAPRNTRNWSRTL